MPTHHGLRRPGRYDGDPPGAARPLPGRPAKPSAAVSGMHVVSPRRQPLLGGTHTYDSEMNTPQADHVYDKNKKHR